MYVILVYDVEVSRVAKINKLLKAYMYWVQNSVFEGHLRKKTLDEMINRVSALIEGKDSVLIYLMPDEKEVEKITVGENKNIIKRFI